MPMKKDPAARLSEAPQPPLRLGRGLRLSRASKQAREPASKPPAAPEPSAPVELAAAAATPAASTIALDAGHAEAAAVAATPIEAAGLSDPEPLTPARDKRKLLLRKDLLKQCKRIARAQDRKLAQVIESALEEYIQRHGAPE